MDTTPPLSDGQFNSAEGSIYGRRELGASKGSRAESRAVRAITGFVLGAAIWMAASQLGIPHIFSLGVAGGELPFGFAGALIGLSRFRGALMWTSASLVVFLAIVGLTGIFSRPARALVRSDPVPVSADAIVVLSSGVTADGFLTEQGTDRLRRALELAQSSVAPVLVVTRERRQSRRRAVTSVGDQDKLIAMAGVKRVVSTGWARSTRDEAMFVDSIARNQGWRHIVVVTSAFHSRRACTTFEKTGLRVSCVPAQSRDISIHALSTPRDRIGAFGMWLYEMAGTVRYRQKGWL